MNKAKIRKEIARLQRLLKTASPESAAVMQSRINAKNEQLYGKPVRDKVDKVLNELPLETETSVITENTVSAESDKAKPKKKSRKKKTTKEVTE